MSPETPAPAIGQVWQDNDPRSPDRFLLITAVDVLHVTARRVAWNPEQRTTTDLPGVRETHISRSRLRPTSTGYRYVGEAS